MSVAESTEARREVFSVTSSVYSELLDASTLAYSCGGADCQIISGVG